MKGLIGSKVGMTRIFTKEGISIPITVIEIKENRIIQIKNIKNDGYNAIQITSGVKKINKIIKPEAGHFAKAGVKVGCGLWEFNMENIEGITVGQNISLEIFVNVKKVDIIGTSKGKGFSGTVKRWNFHTQDSSHGNSLSHRAPGSIGQNQTPGKVFKGKKMSGHLGNERVTIQNLEIIRIDIKRNLLLIKGAVPGVIGNKLIIKPAIKA
ncbi:50S ribosomal protein L3 [Candidatus Mikella endobia]|uniref:Large ribosomal subunit protein uL3 n=1 Tax=Candidatus Mikella endobia TaxID=1778264 RepID=A0A143WQ49_9ENTR|nr:50S ribosomal protein L3 [Candidatus Mikella endobia]CUX95741.1 50S ribosomal protein L3 [Candidatus Mikella endobia]